MPENMEQAAWRPVTMLNYLYASIGNFNVCHVTGRNLVLFITRVKQLKDFLPVLGVPGEVGLSVVPLGFAEVAGSDLVLRANL